MRGMLNKNMLLVCFHARRGVHGTCQEKITKNPADMAGLLCMLLKIPDDLECALLGQYDDALDELPQDVADGCGVPGV